MIRQDQHQQPKSNEEETWKIIAEASISPLFPKLVVNNSVPPKYKLQVGRYSKELDQAAIDAATILANESGSTMFEILADPIIAKFQEAMPE